MQDKASQELLDTWKSKEFIGLEFLDFGLDVLRRLPSKKVNYEHISHDELAKYHTTKEETNAVVNGLEIARGFAALAMVSDGKTNKEIQKLLSYACFRGQSTLEECLQKIETIKNFKDKICENKSAIRMFFEQRDVTPFDVEIVQQLDDAFLEPHPTGGKNDVRHILHECNFVCDASGAVTKTIIDNEIQKATFGTIKKVIPTDLAPDWRARFLLAVVSDENFHIKTNNNLAPTCVPAAFYNSPDNKNQCTFCTYLKVSVTCRRFEASDSICYEFLTLKENETFIIIQPKTAKLSSEFLSQLTAEKIATLIRSCCNGDFIQKVMHIPLFSIPGSIGLRSILNKKPSFFSSNPFAISRIFCPFKAEFTKIIGRKLEACLVFPLYEFYCKSRCTMEYKNLTVENDNSVVSPTTGNDKEPAQNIEKPDTQLVPSGKIISPGNGAQTSATPQNVADDKQEVLQSTQCSQTHPNGSTQKSVAQVCSQKSTKTALPGTAFCRAGRKLPNMKPQRSQLDDSIYNPPQLSKFEHLITIENDASRSLKYDSNENPQIIEDSIISSPFLFMIVSKFQSNNAEFRYPKFIGRFTNIEEVFDEAWKKEA